MTTRIKDDGESNVASIKLDIEHDRSQVTIQKTPFGVVTKMDGCTPLGERGGPAFPSRIVRVALPPTTCATEVKVDIAMREILLEGPVMPAPLQDPAIGLSKGDDPEPQPGRERILDQALTNPRPSSIRGRGEPFVEPIPRQPFVRPNAELYESEIAMPRPAARLVGQEEIGMTPVALVEINPIRLTKKGQLELITRMEIEVCFGTAASARRGKDEEIGPAIAKRVVSRAQAQRLVDLGRMMVVNPDRIFDFTPFFPTLATNVDYLIITDNQTWNAATIEPAGPTSGDLVATFTRLAAWKARRGLNTKVATVTAIVNGDYGNFTSGARDLQEVIRNFLKHAHDQWGATWLLLGGDVSIIPVRRVAGAAGGHIEMGASDPPDENRAFWTGSFVKMNVNGPGTWFPATVAGLTLVRSDTGTLIPYDATGSSNSTSSGWYFATDNTCATRTSTATRYVRINGPAAEINGPLQWLYEWNQIPTDLYYASLIGPDYDVLGRHDWDQHDNGIYGQHTNNTEVDGVDYQTDLSVGRAPVQTVAQAAAFVDKVIAYESFQRPDGTPLDPDWTERLLLVSANWGGRTSIARVITDPPSDDTYYHSAGSNVSLIKLKNAFEDMDWRLLIKVSETDIRITPYDRAAASAGRGWHYAVSATDHSPSEDTFQFFGITFHIPIPTNWVVVYGAADELAPDRYIFDNTAADGSMCDQEKLRVQIETELPKITEISRLYEDEIDLTPAEAAAAPLQHLTGARLQQALNGGQHFISLSGHGNSGGCCALGSGMAQNLTNGLHSSLVYADSCLTNQFDAEDAMSEHLLNNANGGSVAYVGNSRFSWIGVGDNFQRAFFHRLTAARHLGMLHDIRCMMVNENTGYYRLYNKWEIFSLNLLGDPETPIWVGAPALMRLHFTNTIDTREPFRVRVTHHTIFGELPLAGVNVAVSQGDYLRTGVTSGIGIVDLDVRRAELGNIEIVATRMNYRTVVARAEIVGPAWISGTVKVISHQHGAPQNTYVLLDLADPVDGMNQRGWNARRDHADYRIILDAVTDAYVTDKTIHLMVDSIKAGGNIERFRFGEWPAFLALPDIRKQVQIGRPELLERAAIAGTTQLAEPLRKMEAAEGSGPADLARATDSREFGNRPVRTDAISRQEDRELEGRA